MKTPSEIIGGEFVSLVNLIIDFQKKLKKLDKSNKLLECNIRKTSTGLFYSPKFGEKYEKVHLNRALEMHYTKLNFEINRYNN